MGTEKEKLIVKFFGGFSASYCGAEVIDSKQSVSQFASLMQLLLYFRENGVPRSLIKEVLFSDREVDDISHAIRNTMYNAKKRLKAAGLPDVEYITSDKASYSWTEDIPVVSDIDEFERFRALAEDEDDELEKLKFLRSAVQCYRGEFLLGQTTALWAVAEASKLQADFRDTVEDAANIMRSRLMYKELLALADYAASADPYAEWEVISVEALSALGRYDEAIKRSDEAVELYINEHGQRNSTYVRDLANRMSARMQHPHEDIDSIQNNMEPQTHGGRGGFFCAYPVFQEVYRTITRMMSRQADRIWLMLCTVVDSNGAPMPDGPRLEELSARLKDSIVHSIRYSDTVARYGKGQYLVLLTNTSREDCSIVIKRIDRNFLQPGQRTGAEYTINRAVMEVN